MRRGEGKAYFSEAAILMYSGAFWSTFSMQSRNF